MAYLALYRKYRPKTFDQIVGQKAIVQALKNQVRYGQIGHAYLFCGTRGTGKTSTAKVFARAVNCLHPVDGNPCNECELCRESESGFNLIEIDAASNNSVDDIRTLREEVQYTPSKGKYKVYIIDEVHMLSASAFNALLKTLEEPPEHVIFILATTDPQKLLPTIVSRCQRYNFKRITTDEIKDRLQEVCQKENIQATDSALHYIAALSDGGMRDALSLLDQCHSYYMDEDITLPKVQDVLGAVDDSIYTDMTQGLADSNVRGLLVSVEKAFDDGRDAQQFIDGWIRYLRNALVIKTLKDRAAGLVEVEASELERIRQQADGIDTGLLTAWIEELAKLSGELKTASEKRILIEVTLIKMLEGPAAMGPGMDQAAGGAAASDIATSLSSSASESELASERAAMRKVGQLERRLTLLEKKTAGDDYQQRPEQAGAAVESDAGQTPAGDSPKTIPDKEKEQPADGNLNLEGAEDLTQDPDFEKVQSAWPQILDSLEKAEPNLKGLSYMELEPGPGKGVLTLASDKDIFIRLLQKDDRLAAVSNAIADMTGLRYRLVLRSIAQKEKKPVSAQEIQAKSHMKLTVED